MDAPICRTCGNQYPPSLELPDRCRVCDDPRQYVGWSGQEWTTLDELDATHRSEVRELEPDLWGVGGTPSFAIGQRGLIVRTREGNILWDVPGFIDQAGFDAVERIGGLKAISASHPHFYGVAVEWAHAFDATILLPSADREWVTRPDGAHEFYEDELEPLPGVRFVRCGGHFPGSAVLHWAFGADGSGALLTGDTITVVSDRNHLSIMWSYPNLVPLDPDTILRVVAKVAPLRFDRIYGGWWGRVVDSGAKQRLAASIDRYLTIIREGPPA